MNDTDIYINDGQHYHGTVSVQSKHDIEWAVKIDLKLVLLSNEYDNMIEEITKVIEKYAIQRLTPRLT